MVIVTSVRHSAQNRGTISLIITALKTEKWPVNEGVLQAGIQVVKVPVVF